MANAPHRVLIIDDHVELAELLAGLLRDAGLEPVIANTAERGRALAKLHDPRVAVVDLLLPDMPGHSLLKALATPGGPFLVVMTGVFKGPAEMEQVKGIAPIVGWYEKPFDLRLLVQGVLQLLSAAPVTGGDGEDVEIDILDPESASAMRAAPDVDIEVDLDPQLDAPALDVEVAVGGVEEGEFEVEVESEPAAGEFELELGAPAGDEDEVPIDLEVQDAAEGLELEPPYGRPASAPRPAASPLVSFAADPPRSASTPPTPPRGAASAPPVGLAVAPALRTASKQATPEPRGASTTQPVAPGLRTASKQATPEPRGASTMQPVPPAPGASSAGPNASMSLPQAAVSSLAPGPAPRAPSAPPNVSTSLPQAAVSSLAPGPAPRAPSMPSSPRESSIPPAAAARPPSSPPAVASSPQVQLEAPPRRASSSRVITLEELSSAMEDFQLANDPLAAELDRALMAAGLGAPISGSTGDLQVVERAPVAPSPKEPVAEASAIREGFRSKMRTGQVRPATVPRLLTAFFMSQETGEIAFEQAGVRKVVYVHKGRPAFARSNQDSDRLATIARRSFGLTRAQVDQALTETQGTDRMLSEVLAERRILHTAAANDLQREQTRAVIRSLLTWSDGSYAIVFNSGSPLAREEVSEHPAEVVLQGVREAFDLARLRKLVPDRLRPMPAEKPPYDANVLPFGDAEALVLFKATGSTVRELIQDVADKLDEHRTRALIYALMALGLLSSAKVAEAAGTRAASHPPGG